MKNFKKIIVLGLQGSGKTTYLAVLNRALELEMSSWRVLPIGETVKTTSKLLDSIFGRGLFPDETNKVVEMDYKVTRPSSLFGIIPKAEFYIKVIDIPGEATKGKYGAEKYHDFYERNVRDCDGIILLLDVEETWRGGNISSNKFLDIYYPLVSSIVSEINTCDANDSITNSSSISKSDSESVCVQPYIVFCLTKLDKKFGGDSNFVRGTYDYASVEYLAQEIIGKNAKTVIDHYFNSDHINWVPVSAIGYTPLDNKKQSQQIEKDIDGKKKAGILNPQNLEPIGVVESFEWLLDRFVQGDEHSDSDKISRKVLVGLLKLLGR